MTTLPIGIYRENSSLFEFDFAKHLLKINTFQNNHVSGTTVSPFRFIKSRNNLYLLIHNYDRAGDRKIKVESIDTNGLVINHHNTSYQLNRVA